MMPTITSLFGSVALLALVAAGFVLMFAPDAGRRLLKNVAVAVALFVVGSMLLSGYCSRSGP